MERDALYVCYCYTHIQPQASAPENRLPRHHIRVIRAWRGGEGVRTARGESCFRHEGKGKNRGARLSRARASARSATRLAVNMSSLAVAMGSWCARRGVPPAPGKMPRPVSGKQSVASAAASRRSHASATSRPQPKPRLTQHRCTAVFKNTAAARTARPLRRSRRRSKAPLLFLS